MRAPQLKTWYITLVPKSKNGMTISWCGEARSKQAAIKEVWSRHPDKKSTHKLEVSVLTKTYLVTCYYQRREGTDSYVTMISADCKNSAKSEAESSCEALPGCVKVNKSKTKVQEL